MNRFSALFLAVLVISIFNSARADVWTATHEWNDQQEALFGDWIRTLPMDIFSRHDSPYFGIPTDCAEAVYTLRTIFAYEHQLPVHFSDESGKNLRNTNTDFDSIAAGPQRLRKFINLIKTNTNTFTLTADTYPIEINRTYLKAGAVFLHPQSGQSVPVTYRSGHVYYIQDVLDNGMVRYFSSTVPAMVRDLQTRVDIDFAPMNTSGGYRAWKRPVHGAAEPGISTEQFSFAHWRPNAYGDSTLWGAWQHVIRSRLELRKAMPLEEVAAKLENVNGYMKERNHLVQMAWHLYESKYVAHGLKCMNKADYDDYSTPSRDVKIQSELLDLRGAVLKATHGQDFSDHFASYKFEVMPGVVVDANELWNTFETETALAISEPEHSPEVRWGLKQIDQWPCPDRIKQYNRYSNQGGAQDAAGEPHGVGNWFFPFKSLW